MALSADGTLQPPSPAPLRTGEAAETGPRGPTERVATGERPRVTETLVANHTLQVLVANCHASHSINIYTWKPKQE